MIEDILVQLEKSMRGPIDSLKYQLTKIRTGRASPAVLDRVVVNYYGSETPLNQVGQISTPEANLLQLRPFDKGMIGDIEKAILGANLGLTPSNDGNLVRIPFPALTEKTRKEQVKKIKKLGEEAKIAVRNLRREQNDTIKKTEKAKEISEDDSKKWQAEIQTVTDAHTAQIDEIVAVKEKEMLTV